MFLGQFDGRPVDRIVDGLWQGGFPERRDWRLRENFDAIVLCAFEIQPNCSYNVDGIRTAPLVEEVRRTGIRVVCAPMDDAILSLGEAKTAYRAAREVAKMIDEGRRVLVTCQQGRNRSGLVSALTLVIRHGISGAEAAEKVRSMRTSSKHPALSNQTFVNFLGKIPARSRRALASE